VQSAEFVEAHGRPRAPSSRSSGQENNQATWRIARMNLAIHGLSGDLKLGDSLLDDQFPGARAADFVMANPPFNMKRWGSGRGRRRRAVDIWRAGPTRNAKLRPWIQHFIHHLAPDGRAGFVMANGSLTSSARREGEIRQRLVDADLIDCIVSLPGQLFFTTGIPVCLWFVDRNKASRGERDRRGETLFIDVRQMGVKITRTQIDLTYEGICSIADTYRRVARWGSGVNEYENILGFCKAATIEEIAATRYVLTPRPLRGYRGSKNRTSRHLKSECASLSSRLGRTSKRANAERMRSRERFVQSDMSEQWPVGKPRRPRRSPDWASLP